MEWSPASWLDTGILNLNEVFGHREHGIPYGRIVEMSGMESHGKSALAFVLAALAQQDKAFVLWADFENSFDEEWARRRGLDPDNIILIQPYVGKFRGEKLGRMSTAQDLCVEIEAILSNMRRKFKKMFVVIDSVPSMLPDGEAVAGLDGRNLRVLMALPMFMGALLRRWVGLAQAYSATFMFINQLRQNPMAFGDPWYTPGGNALKFYSHLRVRVKRVKGGRILRKGRLVGIQGIVTNLKNKSGGLEGSRVGYRLLFEGPIEFLSVEDLEKSNASD